ncbi:MAG: HAD-IC family P-type ATPase [Patescibacteria group bacterium]
MSVRPIGRGGRQVLPVVNKNGRKKVRMEGVTWYARSVPAVLDELHSGELGLSAVEAARRLKEFGPNALPEKRPDPIAVLFIRQFQSPLIYILLAASTAVFFMGEVVDASIILAVLIFNAIVGTIQEGKAQNTLRALKDLVETKAIVLRGEKEVILSDHGIVPGDIILLQEGAKVPADARIIRAQNLRVDGSSLTGESEPADKIEGVLTAKNLQVADQTNMLFKGTNVVAGNGLAVVVATGLSTEIGKIAKEISAVDTDVPLKSNVRHLSRAIIFIVGSISLAIFALGLSEGYSVRTMFATVVSLAVSIIPEGLPIVMTLILATGVWRMSKRNALVKQLQAVEALGQTQVIAVDKTGTITRNELVIQEVYVDRQMFRIGGVGYEPKGDVWWGDDMIDPAESGGLLYAGKIAALCANARALYSEDEARWRVTGDPTEAAMFVFGQKIGFHKDTLEQTIPLVSEIPFDYRLKYHATVHVLEGKNFLTIVGAPEEILRLSHEMWRDGAVHPLGKHEREEIETAVREMSSKGLRVIAFAVNTNSPVPLRSQHVGKLTFVGLYGMKDALREEVKDAMARAEDAGIRVVMITGDHTLTARAIAKEAGIYHEGDSVLTGHDIDALDNAALSQRLAGTTIFARVTPEHKLRIIQAYKRRGEIIAMTGDGVNDAPSLVAADLGVAMGKMGTEVAKEASDIVLLDDNFGSILSAVEEGRSIYRSIKKVILYLFSTSAGEALTLIGALLLGLPLPLLAAQIIWLNFVTDGFLDVALAMEPKEQGLLSRAFAKPKKYIVDAAMTRRIVLVAVIMMLGTLYLFKDYVGGDMTKAWTIALTTLAAFQWFNAWNCRSDHKSIFQMDPFSNLYLVGATGIVIVLQLLAVYNPLLQAILHTAPLTLAEWTMILGVAVSIVIAEEVRKLFYRLQTAPA